jgi:hypothetical protein
MGATTCGISWTWAHVYLCIYMHAMMMRRGEVTAHTAATTQASRSVD